MPIISSKRSDYWSGKLFISNVEMSHEKMQLKSDYEGSKGPTSSLICDHSTGRVISYAADPKSVIWFVPVQPHRTEHWPLWTQLAEHAGIFKPYWDRETDLIHSSQRNTSIERVGTTQTQSLHEMQTSSLLYLHSLPTGKQLTSAQIYFSIKTTS